MKLKIISTAILGLLIFLILNFQFPGLMNFHEQNQLFLFTTDYFLDRISTCGGLSDYVSEFFVQFFYVPAYGAWIYAFALVAIQLLTFNNFYKKDKKLYFLSFIPSILIFLYLGNENLLFSYIISIIFSLFNIKFSEKYTKLSLIISPILYWLIGEICLINLIFIGYKLIKQKNFILLLTIPIIYFISAICFVYIMPHQYPINQVLLGINYYRIPNHYHFMMFFIPLIIDILIIISDIINIKKDSKIIYITQYSIIFLSFLFVNITFDKLKFRLINYDYLLRHKCYNNIIHKSAENQPETNFERVCINFSLAQKGLLAEKVFDYSQNGCAGLLSDATLDNMSCLPSMEAYFYLGMINTSLQYALDSQEAIMNNRKSGRLLKRMAECFIVNKKYTSAKRYLLILSHSFYYSDWAKKYLKIVETNNQTDLDDVYKTLRANRFKENFIFYYPELSKMLGKLYIENNSNYLAQQYFYVSTLLNKDLQTFVSVYQSLNEPQKNLPKSYQQAWAMIWSGTHNNFSEIPVEISSETVKNLLEIAKHYSADNNADNLQKKFGYNFWTYYFKPVSNIKQ